MEKVEIFGCIWLFLVRIVVLVLFWSELYQIHCLKLVRIAFGDHDVSVKSTLVSVKQKFSLMILFFFRVLEDNVFKEL